MSFKTRKLHKIYIFLSSNIFLIHGYIIILIFIIKNMSELILINFITAQFKY